MQRDIKEKVKINDQEFEIRLLPITPQTDNTTSTLNPKEGQPWASASAAANASRRGCGST